MCVEGWVLGVMGKKPVEGSWPPDGNGGSGDAVCSAAAADDAACSAAAALRATARTYCSCRSRRCARRAPPRARGTASRTRGGTGCTSCACTPGSSQSGACRRMEGRTQRVGAGRSAAQTPIASGGIAAHRRAWMPQPNCRGSGSVQRKAGGRLPGHSRALGAGLGVCQDPVEVLALRAVLDLWRLVGSRYPRRRTAGVSSMPASTQVPAPAHPSASSPAQPPPTTHHPLAYGLAVHRAVGLLLAVEAECVAASAEDVLRHAQLVRQRQHRVLAVCGQQGQARASVCDESHAKV